MHLFTPKFSSYCSIKYMYISLQIFISSQYAYKEACVYVRRVIYSKYKHKTPKTRQRA